MTSRDIFNIIRKELFTTQKYVINNAHIFSTGESDYFGMSELGYAYEVEIKISRSDFKKDFTKTEKHRILACNRPFFVWNAGHSTTPYDANGNMDRALYRAGVRYESTHIRIDRMDDILRPNLFWYACPWGLIKESELPKYAGLIWMPPKGYKYPQVVKRAPFIDKIKRNYDKILLDKFYNRHVYA